MPPINEWLVTLIVVVTPLVLTILDYAFDQVSAKIPFWLKPILVTGLAAAMTYLGGIVTTDPLLIALIGLATAGLNELIRKLGQGGAFGGAVKARWMRVPA